jgi:hypothetical protein
MQCNVVMSLASNWLSAVLQIASISGLETCTLEILLEVFMLVADRKLKLVMCSCPGGNDACCHGKLINAQRSSTAFSRCTDLVEVVGELSAAGCRMQTGRLFTGGCTQSASIPL